MQFWGSESAKAHARWYRTIAAYHDRMGDPKRPERAAAALHRLFRRRGPVQAVLDVACGTFSIDLLLVRVGYTVVGRDLSPHMVRVARRDLRSAGLRADVGPGDMRTLRLGRTFDAVVCLGSAFNYLVSREDSRLALATFRRHLRPDGVLLLDTTNFDPWIEKPRNTRAEVDYHAPNGTRIAIFALNEQDRRRSVHTARFLTAVQHGRRIDLTLDEAPLRIWTKESLAKALRESGFRPAEWWGDLRVGVRYERRRSPRMVVVAIRL